MFLPIDRRRYYNTDLVKEIRVADDGTVGIVVDMQTLPIEPPFAQRWAAFAERDANEFDRDLATTTPAIDHR